MKKQIKRTGKTSKTFDTVLKAERRARTVSHAYPEHKVSRVGKTVTVILNGRSLRDSEIT